MTRLRIGLAQVNPTVGDLAGNMAKILGYYEQAEAAGCDIVAFPELCITGYPPEDLVLKPGFVADNKEVLATLATSTLQCVAVVGFVDNDNEGHLYNAAAVCANGQIRGTYRKRLLPNYAVFDEARYFTPGGTGDPMELFVIGGINVGVSICEDIWSAAGPVADQAAGGAELLININGSPYERGKVSTRERMLSTRAADAGCALVYVNQVCGQDELVFDGASMMFDAEGELVARAAQYTEELLIVDIDVQQDQHASPSLHRVVVNNSPLARADAAAAAPRLVDLLDPVAEMYQALVLGTRDYVRKNGFTDVVIGLSGGIDSTIVACIAVDALGAGHVHGVSMPSRYSSDGSKDDAKALADNLGIDYRTVAIEPAFGAYLDMLAPSFLDRSADLTEENLQSRIRGTTLMGLSNKFGWMVLTTGNKSEMAVGYFTLYGDSVGGYAVIKDVLKTRVYDLCRHYNQREGREIIPQAVITKPPSAELRPDQRDDQSLPPYEVLDPILELYVEDDRTAAEIIAAGHDPALVRRITRLVDLNEYKRRQCPPGVRVSSKAFGKDRRLPITNGYRG